MAITLIDALISPRRLACATISQWSLPSTVARYATVCGYDGLRGRSYAGRDGREAAESLAGSDPDIATAAPTGDRTLRRQALVSRRNGLDQQHLTEKVVGIEVRKCGSTVNISARPPWPSVSRRDCAHRPASRHRLLAQPESRADARPHCSQFLSNSPPRGRFRR